MDEIGTTLIFHVITFIPPFPSSLTDNERYFHFYLLDFSLYLTFPHFI